jgi:prolyl-tRNA synthetase
MASIEEIQTSLQCEPGFLGPVGANMPIIVDRSAAHLVDFVCGANEPGYHLTHVVWNRDLPMPTIADIRKVVVGDPSPDGKGLLQMARGIEVGHIFQLGQKYSAQMGATVIQEDGQLVSMSMGCYGIGVSRIVAAAIEQNHDDKGIIWPSNMAPFQVAIVPINAEKLYQQLQAAGIDVLLDDRKERPGVMFADMELMGIPHRLVVGERHLASGMVEYKGRRDPESQLIPLESITEILTQI